MPPHFLHKCFNFYKGPVPKLSRTPGQLPNVIKDLHAGEHSIEVLQEAGYPQKVYITLKTILCNLRHVYTPQEIKQLMSDGVVIQYKEESKL